MFKFTANKHNIDNLTNTLKTHIKAIYSDDNWMLSVSAIPHKSKRSNEANRRMWAIYKELSDHIGEPSERVHELMKYKFLRREEVINGELVVLVKSTTELNTKEMSEYQRNVEIFAQDMGLIIDF